MAIRKNTEYGIERRMKRSNRVQRGIATAALGLGVLWGSTVVPPASDQERATNTNEAPFVAAAGIGVIGAAGLERWLARRKCDDSIANYRFITGSNSHPQEQVVISISEGVDLIEYRNFDRNTIRGSLTSSPVGSLMASTGALGAGLMLEIPQRMSEVYDSKTKLAVYGFATFMAGVGLTPLVFDHVGLGEVMDGYRAQLDNIDGGMSFEIGQ